MKKNIIIASLALISSSVLFVINDAIINYLSVNQIEFYHFIFYGSPPYILVIIFLLFKGDLNKHIKCNNYWPPIIRGLIFAPMPFITFISLKNISLPEFTTLNMASPLVGSIYAFIFLKEKLNSYIYVSLIIGFFGVLFVIQPGFENFNIYFIVTLFGVFLITTTTTIVNKYNNATTTIGFFIYGQSKTDYGRGYIRLKDDKNVYLTDKNISYMLSTSPSYWGEVPSQDVPTGPSP